MEKKIWEMELFVAENLKQTEKVVEMIKKFGLYSTQAREIISISERKYL